MIIQVYEGISREVAKGDLSDAIISSKIVGEGLGTDGSQKGTFFLKRRFDSNKCEIINDIHPYVIPISFYGFRLIKSDDGKSSEKQLQPIDCRIENIFFEKPIAQ